MINNDDNDNPVCKRWKSSRCLCGHQHMPIQKEDLSDWSSLWVTVLCFVKKTKVALLLCSLKWFLCPVLGCVATQTSIQKKSLHFANWISTHELFFWWKVACCHWWSVFTYPSCCSTWSSTLTCANAMEYFFREMVLALISPWYTVKVDDG